MQQQTQGQQGPPQRAARGKCYCTVDVWGIPTGTLLLLCISLLLLHVHNCAYTGIVVVLILKLYALYCGMCTSGGHRLPTEGRHSISSRDLGNAAAQQEGFEEAARPAGAGTGTRGGISGTVVEIRAHK